MSRDTKTILLFSNNFNNRQLRLRIEDVFATAKIKKTPLTALFYLYRKVS
jgi:hypothetical protein